jgi:hypothetical protein
MCSLSAWGYAVWGVPTVVLLSMACCCCADSLAEWGGVARQDKVRSMQASISYSNTSALFCIRCMGWWNESYLVAWAFALQS